MKTGRTDNTKNNQHEDLTDQGQQSPSQSHGDLEHTSPTDSRADEKVIVNHRSVPDSFSRNNSGNNQKV